MKLKDFMTTNLEYIRPDATVYDAIERMVDRRIRSLVILPQADGAGHGVITARDVVCKVLARGADPGTVRVSDIASMPLLCMDGEKSLRDAALTMAEHNIARVFICDGDKILGMVSLLDAMQGTLVSRARGGNV